MKAMRKWRQHLTAIVALTLLALSLRHLAEGIGHITGSGPVESWLMAVGIDLAMIAAEVAVLCRTATRWGNGLITATLALSAALNVLAFQRHASGDLGQVLAVALGIFVPAAVYGLVQILGTRDQVRIRIKAVAAKTAKRPKLRAVA